ncbi:MAG: T9SS type A sorting domain-containing protein [Bacteroidetes bacterium]|nr:T9SS type A sorting domain-containing protein [Bacteroidota bacterium]
MKIRVFISLLSFLALSVSGQTYNYYFGNLHSHTALSDGNKDSASSGVNNPTGAYAYAKLSQNFNFLGVSEHNHYSSANNPGFQIQSYTLGLNQAAAANQPGTFLTLFGIEYGVSSNYNGHIITYGFNQLIGWESGNYDIFNAKTDYDGFFKKVKNNPGAFCYLAHPQFSDFTTNGTAATALINMPYNATYDSAIVGTPLRSGLAFSTFTNYLDYPNGNYFYYYTKLLSIGYHVGIGYDHDNHYTTFGRNNAGRLVIVTPSLTIPNLYTAMQKMNFYGSDDWNAKVAFTNGTNIMGAQLSGSVNPTFNITHNDGDGEIADSIKIWRGVSNSGGILPQVISITKQSNTKTFTDASLNLNIEYYYFVEIKQNDGDWIVTSPIWYKLTNSVGMHEQTPAFEFNYFPNPVSQKLFLSMAVTDNYRISIIDISGREVYQHTYNDNRMEIDLHNLTKGIYSLKVSSPKQSLTKRLVIE